MCSDKNGAPHTVRYLNAQLAVHHENARICLEEHDGTEENKHFYALAGYTVLKPGTSDTAFYAAFNRPKLEFVCNHDAILHLALANSHLVLDSLQLGGIGQLEDVNLPNNLQLTYRLGFEIRRIVGKDSKIDGYSGTIELVFLDVKNATLVTTKPEVTVGRDLLLKYITDYLDFLHSAEHHVLVSLPQSNQHAAPMPIDFSLMGTAQLWVGDIHGVTVEHINTHVSSVWLQSTMVPLDGSTNTLAELSYGASAYGNFRPFHKTIQRTKMFGFDQVVAISQGSINAQLSALSAHMQSIFYRWKYEDFFEASFKPMSVRLLSHNRAIVWVHSQGGHLKTLQGSVPWDGSMNFQFGEWRLAFEVKLKMCSQTELEATCSDACKKGPAYDKHGSQFDRELHHIYLDLHNAEYLNDHSTLGDLASGDDKLEAAKHYITKHYFIDICKDAQNVISSVPVWKSGTSLPSLYALTSVEFQVYSKVEITRHNWAHVTAGMEPVVVVFGTTDFRNLPSKHLDYSTGWVVQGNNVFSHGTISIAKHVFILNLLSRLNALTTLIPPPPADGMQAFHGFKLQPWAEHEKRKDTSPSDWELQPSDTDESSKYMWEHCEEWRYKLKGTSRKMRATHEISCTTRNYVEIPTAVNQGALCIKISGQVELELSLEPTQPASSSVSWSTDITIQTTGSGIKVGGLGLHDPVFTRPEFTEGHASRFRNPMDMLREAFPPKVNLDELVQDINAFESAWQYHYPLANAYSLASPAFNDDGDILFQLRL
ncbi:hypothetical protein C8Q76DRAFT_818580 [Earliella scabrosa]|nr:hypothetical protein C8Q76DRAFT_818580 [Earliella scabrosa]